MASTEPAQTRSATAPFHVAIIGAGLGGLCLAHGLAGAGIEASVYERDASAQVRAQGYRISLKDTGARALHRCLPAHLFDLCVATALRPATRMVFTDTQLRPLFGRPIPPAPPGLGGFGVNRLTLREILLTGLPGRVHFGRAFTGYQPAGRGRVTARFADGTEVTADLLVGADGTHSAVRRQLAPGAVLDELARAVYGRTPMAAGTTDWLPDLLTDSFNRVIGDGDAAFSVATCRPYEPAPATAARPALTDIPDYLQWTVTLPGVRPPTDDPGALHGAAADLVAGWHPAVRRVIADADVAATFPVRVASARPVPRWNVPAVTLLGDAIHTMSPGRGDGANTALRDACTLTRALARAAAGDRSPAEATRAYEADMLEYGFAAVEASRHRPFSPHPDRRSAPEA